MRSLPAPRTAEDDSIVQRLWMPVAAEAIYEDYDRRDADSCLRMMRDRLRFDLARPRERILLDLP